MRKLSKNFIYATALQINVFGDFFKCTSQFWFNPKLILTPHSTVSTLIIHRNQLYNLIRMFSIGLVSMTQQGVSDQSRSSGGFLLSLFSPATFRDFLLFSSWDPPCLNLRANTFCLSSFRTLNLMEPEVPPKKAAFIVKQGTFEVDNLRSKKWVGFSLEFWDSPL